MVWNSNKSRPIHLIIDDDEIRDQIIQLLSKVSSEVIALKSAEEFLTAPISKTPACLITEVKLHGSDGITLIRKMREYGLSTPVVVLANGNHNINTAVKAIQAGASDFIEKPIVERDFLERVQSILEKHN